MNIKKSLLVNKYEIFTNKAIDKIASKYNAKVCTKVRIADILEITNSGLRNSEYKYALQAHFDFVITTGIELSPEFVIEFDEKSHKQYKNAIDRDKLKNFICNKFELPLFRVNANFIKGIGNFPPVKKKSIFAGYFDSLVGWIVEIWFLQKAFHQAQLDGQIPFDEPFCWFSILGQDPFAQSKLYLHQMYQEKYCTEYIPKIIKGQCDNEFTWASLTILSLNNGNYIIGFAECTSVHFSAISAYEICEELAILNLAQELLKYQSGKFLGLNKEEIEKQEETFRNKYYIPAFLE
ncbi:hypothetical protein NIES2111_22240 [Nostoc sp. NIES-2111]|nr:hypothetical protein NIES2111_22240 [Nostoc sp. NIES-2111]